MVVPAIAGAQPLDPYAPTPNQPQPAPPAPPPPAPNQPTDPYAGQDPVLAEQVAQSLVQRAQELYDAKVYPDAKQLAVEALVKSPKGPSAEHAQFIIHQVNQQLGIVEEDKTPKVDLTPIEDPTLKKDKLPEVPKGPEDGELNRKVGASIHGGIYAGLLGATIGSFFDDQNQGEGAALVGIAAGVAGAAYTSKLTEKLGMDEAQIRTTGSGSVWGGVIGGLFGDAVTLKHTDARAVLVGSSIGATAGLAGGYLLARERTLTPGDVALIDTMAGIGTLGGLTAGMLMQPAEKDAYAVNSIVGATAGVVAGLVAAPQTNTTQRRMLRVAGLSLAGGAAPFLLYAAIRDNTTTADERITGALSTAGLVVGAYIGFRLTEGMDEGLDVLPGAKKKEPVIDAPPAVVGRGSDGRWGLGGLGLQPLSPQLAPQRGMSLSLFGAAF
jgi:hypothetical protein